MIGRRILVLSPHPDDEVVGAATAIGRAGVAGAAVFLLHLTTGIPAREVLWPWQRRRHPDRVARRRAEAGAVASALGATIAGFSDRPSRGLKDDLPAARAEVMAALARFDIDRLWVPAYEGGHADHDAASGLAATLRGRVAVWEFAEYNFAGGRIHPNSFPHRRGPESTLVLSTGEADAKAGLLRLYASEQNNLGHAGLTRECFRPLADYDYRQPPHPGTLFYRRFQWVPFRHPRIDFTGAEAVSRAVAALAATQPPVPPP
ncbi:MAG: PIG-L family deacetylase [Rhodospirillaceae bacterium]